MAAKRRPYSLELTMAANDLLRLPERSGGTFSFILGPPVPIQALTIIQPQLLSTCSVTFTTIPSSANSASPRISIQVLNL